MQALGEDYLTVAEAAALPRVGRSTIRRWIRRGHVPAYRIGQRRVALKRTDLTKLITPARSGGEQRGDVARAETDQVLHPTAEQRRQALAAVAAAKRLQDELLERRGGKPFSPSWELLNEARDERTRQLS